MPRVIDGLRAVLVLAASAAASLGVPGTAAAAAEPGAAATRIAVSRTPLSTPFYVAEARGYFRDAGVDVVLEECIGGHRCLARALAGTADLATVSEAPVAFRSFERDDFAIAATFVTSENDVKVVARRSAGIASPADLAGKRVGTVLGTSSHFFLDVFLLFHGVDPASVEVVGVAPERMPGALGTGEIDAISVWEPFGYLAVSRLGDDAVVLPAGGVYRETFNLVCVKAWCDRAPATVSAVLSALARSVELIAADPGVAQAVVKERLGLEQGFIEWIWPDFRFSLALDQALVLTLEGTAQWAIEKGLVKASAVPNFLEYVLPGPLEALKPRQVTLLHRRR